MTNTPNQGMELLACPFCGGEVCISPARVQGEADCISHLPIVGGHRCGIDEFSNFAYDDDVAALWNTRTTPTPASSGVLVEAADEQIEEWLAANCGKGLPHGEATTEAEMLHGLAYVLRQIESTHEYKVFIGQCISATSALRMALFHFARQALSSASTDTGAREGEPKLKAARASDPDSQPEGTLEALETCASMLETYMPECMPANEHGQVDFVRCMTDATAAEIRAFLANQEQDNG